MITIVFTIATLGLLSALYSHGFTHGYSGPTEEPSKPEYIFTVNLLGAPLGELRKLYHLYKGTGKEKVIQQYRKERIVQRWKKRTEERALKELEKRLENAGIDPSRLSSEDLEHLLKIQRTEKR